MCQNCGHEVVFIEHELGDYWCPTDDIILTSDEVA